MMLEIERINTKVPAREGKFSYLVSFSVTIMVMDDVEKYRYRTRPRYETIELSDLR